MASLSPPTFPPPSTRSEPNTHKPTFTNSRFFILHPPPIKRPLSSSSSLHTHTLPLPRASDSFTCRCNSQSDSPSPYHSQWRWDSILQDVVRNVIKQIDSYINAHKDRSKDVQSGGVVKSKCDGNENEDWDWDRWRKHFKDVEEQERIVSILKLQLGHAVIGEDYADAARLKVAIAAAVENDTVGEVMSHLNRAIKNEHYRDAAFIRDHAGTGLVGWWAGISEDSNDPYGRIIRITAEHGRYVARSYTPRRSILLPKLPPTSKSPTGIEGGSITTPLATPTSPSSSQAPIIS